MPNALNTAISGLSAFKTALSTTGHNIANASTPGYSRQEVVIGTNLAQYKGFGYVGNGANLEGVRRLHDQFLTEQVRSDTAVFHDMDANRSNIEQINRLLADERTGLAPSMDKFFSAIQNAASNPSNVPVREVLIAEAGGLVERFHLIQSRFEEQNDTLNGQMRAISANINALAEGIAEINEDIVTYQGDQTTAPPNDLFDKRDEMVRQLNELTRVEVTEIDGAYDIFLGTGQALVQRYTANSIEVVDGRFDPDRQEIKFVSDVETVFLTDSLNQGGQLAGILNFRKESLDPSMQQLGRLAVGFADQINHAHKNGLTLAGEWGQNFFQDFNTQEAKNRRIEPAQTNAPPNDRVMSVSITDTSALTGKEFYLEFPGPRPYNYQIREVGSNTILKDGSVEFNFPETIEFQGMDIELFSGTFQAGDRFLVSPTRFAAKDVKLAVTQPDELALASPVKAQTAFGNMGSGEVNQGEILNRNSKFLAQDNKLDPPLLIMFEPGNRYSIYDNSDPLNPKALTPPLEHLPYIPGTSNNLLPDTEGLSLVRSQRGQVPFQPFKQLASATDLTPGNGFNPERLKFDIYDAETDSTMQRTIDFPANAPASEVATTLSSLNGVTARAYTTVELTNFKNGNPPYAPPNPLEITINGVNLTEDLVGSQSTQWGDDVIRELPSDITADFIANRINNSLELQGQGVYATSDGSTLRIVDTQGDDVQIEMRGDKEDPAVSEPGDTFEVSNGERYQLPIVQGDLKGLLSDKRGFDFATEGPYVWNFNLPDGTTGEVVMGQKFDTADDWMDEVERQINAQLTGPGRSEIEVSPTGELQFRLLTKMGGYSNNDSAKLTIGGQVDVELDPNVTMETLPPYGNRFDRNTNPQVIDFGVQFQLNGRPEPGDSFTIDWNEDPSNDNRNALAMAGLQLEDTLASNNGGLTFNEAYGVMVERIGTRTAQLQISTEAAEGVLEQASKRREAISGVNLDEEASRLIEFQNAYQANAQVIKVAREMFNTLLQSF
ncbi:flagellar hook-associated protein FlgK [Salinibius halmophilus]|uniref:flagellar hook-associated protein FlgK n=1 Tax=Salinibius halmophilus TaxID=1853216 RepID=UPI000E670C44|nr:flagellar hook-associated protein FlgK [Salinibius halmophilus]